MHGVPGFESGEDIGDLAFERIDENQAISIASASFDVQASSAIRLDTERDDSFRLTTPHGDRVLKVAHPADDVAAIELPLRALEHATTADPTLPLQRIVRSTSGGPLQLLPSGRVAWMFEWMPGALLLHAAAGPAQLAALGTMLGRLSTSLSDFPAADAHRLSAWDLHTVPRLSALLAVLPNDAVAEAISRYNTRVVPRLEKLPMQVIHNDFNPGNVLVDPERPEVIVGILDFGDMAYSLRAADLAVALCYQLAPLGHGLADLGPMIDAFDRRVRLNDTEVEVLPDLIAARFAQRILVRGWLSRNGQDRASGHQHDANVSALTALLNLEA